MKRSKNVYHYQIRKLKKSQDQIKKNKLLDACINGDNDLFKEIKKIRNTKPCVADSIDGVKEGIVIISRIYMKVCTTLLMKLKNLSTCPTLLTVKWTSLVSMMSRKSLQTLSMKLLTILEIASQLRLHQEWTWQSLLAPFYSHQDLPHSWQSDNLSLAGNTHQRQAWKYSG